MLRTTEGSVKGALQRARAKLDRCAAATPRIADAASPSEGDVARRFADALASDDVDGLVALAERATRGSRCRRHRMSIRAPRRSRRSSGPGSRFASAATSGSSRRARTGQPAYACYLPDPDTGVGRPAGLVVLTVDRGRIRRSPDFSTRAVFDTFGLPATSSG